MANLVYITNTSLDGYVEDESGAYDWTDPSEIFDVITNLVRPIRTYLYGRRLYATMSYWSAPLEAYPPVQREFARIWQETEKVVFSTTLTNAAALNTRVERSFDVEAVARLKRESAHDIGIGGAELAGVALTAQLVDECHLFVHPIIVGAGKPAFPRRLRYRLKLLSTASFKSGVIHLRYKLSG